jgi:hypothetical protein
VIVSVLCVAVAEGGAQEPNGTPPATPPAAGSGPYNAVMEMDARLPGYTIYRPEDLSALSGTRLPIILWGNGACANTGNFFEPFLTEISSYGYFVIALGPIRVLKPMHFPARPPRTQGANPPSPPPNLPPPATHPAQLIAAMTWAIAENQRSGSNYYEHLDTKTIAVMGQSCGGVQALEVAADPRIKTAVIWNSGLFPKPTAMGGGKTMSKSDLKLLHSPIAYISGDSQDIAFVNANDDFKQITSIPAFRAYERGVGHGGTYLQPNGGEYAGVAIAWLNWQLKGDRRSALMFRGASCGLCVNPRWVVDKKNID